MSDAHTELSCDQAGACVVIPAYNHARTVGGVVQGALEHASTVLVCDDGSTDGSGEAAEKAGGILLRHETNRGKGVALRTLLEEASRRGFRYAISLDADGQHFPADLPVFARRASEEPGALFIGARDLCAARAPPSSEFGRRFSNFWLWFESSWRVDDSQCGYRAYPLPETLQLATNRHRYDFEVEVLLRAAWAGLALRSVPVGVVYPADRVTHFRPFADNARISLLNLVSCFRLIMPLPLAKRLRPIPHRPGLSLFALRRWAWLGARGPIFRLLAGGSGIVLSTNRIPGGLALATLAFAFGGLGALPLIASYFGMRALIAAGLPILAAAAMVAGSMIAIGTLEARRFP